jgi:hypothetical protein
MVAEVYEKMQNGNLLQCSRNSMALIGGLTLQSQLGDYQHCTRGCAYAKRFFICLDQDSKLEEEMEAFHQSSECRGLTPSDCDKEILSLARQQPLYGVHQCDAMDSVGQSISLGVCWRGLIVLKGDIIVNTFNWICVRKSFVKKDIFFIEVKANSETCQIGFCLGSKKAAKHFRRLFVDCHAFYMEAPRGRTLPRPISMSHTTVNEDKEVDIHSKSLFRRYSSILPKERDRSLSSLSSLSRYKSVSSSQSASSSSSSGKFDLQLSLPDALCSIRQSSLRFLHAVWG